MRDKKQQIEQVDAHCHLESIKNYELTDTLPVTCGFSHTSNLKNREIGKKLGIPYVMGIAPQTAIKADLKDMATWVNAIRTGMPNAIGEIGLDFHWAENEEHIKKERIVFARMVELAEEMRLPVVIHSRKAEAECLEYLKERKFSNGIMLHFYSGDEKTARIALDLDALVSVTPLHSKERKKVINLVPIENIVIETDAPYVVRTPNEVSQSAAYVAEVKGLKIEDVKAITMKTALKFFRFNL